ncbi:MAG TPA: glycosyltransferase family 2 protein [Candidatus Paceibacterota bacterium]
MKISVVIPTCDRPIEFLKESALSALNQTAKPFEIIIVNNGKSPIKLPDDIARSVKIINAAPYIGASAARNFGADKALGDFIAFLDDDDLWSDRYLENVTKALEEGAQCVISRLDKKIGDKIIPFKNIDGNLTIKNLLLYNPGINGSNIVLSKKIFFEIGGFDQKLKTSEDKSLVIELLKKNIPLKTLPDNQAILREHAETSRLSDSKRLAEGKLQFLKKYSDIMDTETRLYNWKKIFEHRFKSGNYFAGFEYLTAGITLKIVKFMGKFKK